MQDGARASLSRRRIVFSAAAVLVFAADQLTKALAINALFDGRRVPIVGDIFGLALVRNSGAAFGLFQNGPIIIFFLSLAVFLIVVVWATRTGQSPIPLGLIAGGGSGNLADRVWRGPRPGFGRVVDFLDLNFWPTFNVGDSAIVIGVGLLLVASFIKRGSSEEV